MTTKGRDYPTRISCEIMNKARQIVLDQIRTIDKARLIKKLGSISRSEAENVLDVLQDLIA